MRHTTTSPPTTRQWVCGSCALLLALSIALPSRGLADTLEYSLGDGGSWSTTEDVSVVEGDDSDNFEGDDKKKKDQTKDDDK